MIKFEKKEQTILIASLNWGLGHASRMIPVIRKAIHEGKDVILASDGAAATLWKIEFPDLVHVTLPEYNIKYSKTNHPIFISVQFWKILRGIFREKYATKQLVETYNPDLIISDHRFGVRHKKVKSLIVIHQLQMITPLRIFNGFANRINHWLINKFDACLIPDNESQGLGGYLTNTDGIKRSYYIGPLSRLKSSKSVKKVDVLLLFSGLEPQRSIFEALCLEVLKKSKVSYTLIRGTIGVMPDLRDVTNRAISVYNVADSILVNACINESTIVVARAGYSTIMDLYLLKQKAILVPTPGQPEQEYLGKHLTDNPLFSIIEQKNVKMKLLDELNHLLN